MSEPTDQFQRLVRPSALPPDFHGLSNAVDGWLHSTREIRRREGANRRVPILAMTAQVLAACRELCLAEASMTTTSKPVKMEFLFRALRQRIPARYGADMPAATNPR